jgi:hypothetical protein
VVEIVRIAASQIVGWAAEMFGASLCGNGRIYWAEACEGRQLSLERSSEIS